MEHARTHPLSQELRDRERERGLPVHILEILQPRRMRSAAPKGERSFDPFSFLSFPPDRLVLSSYSSSTFPPRDYTRNTTVIYPAGSRRVIYRDLIAFNPTGAIVNREAWSRHGHACCRYVRNYVCTSSVCRRGEENRRKRVFSRANSRTEEEILPNPGMLCNLKKSSGSLLQRYVATCCDM